MKIKWKYGRTFKRNSERPLNIFFLREIERKLRIKLRMRFESQFKRKFKRKIKNYTKGYFLHFKIQGEQKTLEEIKSKTKLDGNIVRFLIVKYKNLDLKTEYFSKNKS